jgi:acyl carrier protein
MIRAVLEETYRVDSLGAGRIDDRLVDLVKNLLGSNATVPTPFPFEQQLSDLGISSLKMVNLMLAVEIEFDIAIPQSDITPENFHSLASIEALVSRTLALRKSG